MGRLRCHWLGDIIDWTGRTVVAREGRHEEYGCNCPWFAAHSNEAGKKQAMTAMRKVEEHGFPKCSPPINYPGMSAKRYFYLVTGQSTKM